MDADVLRGMVRDAARTALAAVRRKQPGERFYAFALQSLDDASGVYAHANTEEGYQRTLARKRGNPWAVNERYCRWYWGEWDHTNVEAPSFRGIYEFIRLNAGSVSPPGWWDAGRAVVFAAMVGALADLDGEGGFGRGAEREQLTLFCTVEDSFCREWVEDESSARLNPPLLYRAFAPSEVDLSSLLKPVHDAFVGRLEGWGLARRAEPSAAADPGLFAARPLREPGPLSGVVRPGEATRMALRDPFAAYNAGSNVEAHLVCGLLRDAGIQAEVVEDVSQVGVWLGGTVAEIHKPQVWIERADIDRARPVLTGYERRNAERRAAERGEREAGPPVEVVCEECGRRSEFPAAQRGTVQSCPHCRAFVDVGDDVGFEGWDEAAGEDEA